MNKSDNSSQSDGSDATGLSKSSDNNANSATMKRTKEKIEQYFHQVTKGCGKEKCENENCASNPAFQPLDANNAAVKALRLYQSKATLCEKRTLKLHKQSSGDGDAASQETQQPTKLALFEEPSTSSAVSRSVPSPTTSAEKPPIELQLDELLHVIDLCKTGQNWQPLIKLIGQVFSSADALKNSFCQAGELQIDAVEKAFEAILTIEESSLKSSLQTALGSLCFQLDVDMRVRGPSLENDPQFLNVFLLVFELPMLYRVSDSSVSEGLISSLCKTAAHLSLSRQATIAKCWSQACIEKLRRLLQVLHQAITDRVLAHLQNGAYQEQSSELESLQEDDAIAAAAKVMNMLYYACLLGGRCDTPQVLAREKEVNQQEEVLLLGFWENDDPQEEEKARSILNIVSPLGASLALHAVDCRQPKLAHNEFLNDILNEHVHMERDFINFKVSHENDAERDSSTRRTKFSFLDYPFLLTCANKVVALTYDNRIRMYREQRQAIITSLFHSTPFMSPFLRLSVRRDHLIEDALSGLELIAMQDPTAFKKQLHVEFDGEQGLDEGGLSKEFFQLITEQLLNQDFGMFIHDKTTNQLWFNPIPFESEREFSLIGMLLGLAIYNGIILNVAFPNVLYRKLLGKIGTLDDLERSHPIIYRSLRQMLVYEGDDFTDTFMVPFQIAYNDVCGNTVTHDLILDGSRHLVAQENKALFADLYADYLLNQSIDRQFRAFKRGFQLVTEESPLRWLFRPDEVELLVCGRQGELHFSEMEETTRYDGGFSSESETVKHLWSVLHSLSQDEKRLFLQFTTGSDRIPVGGLSKLKLVIARNGPDSERLPTAHTCFNVLLLPDYLSCEKLREKLLKAIQNAKGFGMM